MAKEYICSLSPSGTCNYGGNKHFDYGFLRGTAEFCRHPKQKTFVHRLNDAAIQCPKQALKGAVKDGKEVQQKSI